MLRPLPAQGSFRHALTAVLAAAVVVTVVFAVVYRPLDLEVYRWGGEAVRSDGLLYRAGASGHPFTYPPFAALLFAGLGALPPVVVRVVWELASLCCLAVVCRTSARLAGCGSPLPVLVAALVLEPVWHTLFLGQINLLLLALVLPAAVRGRGVAIGLAAAVKLTPLVFAAYFVVTGRWRAAAAAAGTFCACGLVAGLLAPGASRMYWTGLFLDARRNSAPYISNQSPYGAAVRVLGVPGPAYVLVPLVLGAAGLAVARALDRRGDRLGAVTATGVTGLLVSPISWTHHWVWAVPALLVLVRDGARFAALPGYAVFVIAPPWWTPHSGGPREYGWHWLTTAAANAYLLLGAAFLCLQAYGLLRARRRDARPPGARTRDGGRPVSAALVRAGPGRYQTGG